MLLFESTAVFFYVVSHVSYVTPYIFAVPTEVATVTEVVMVNNDVTMPTFQRISMDSFDGRQKKARVKREAVSVNPDKVSHKAKLTPTRLMRLVILFFRNMFSSEPIDGSPALTPADAAKPIALMIHDGVQVLVGKPDKEPDLPQQKTL